MENIKYNFLDEGIHKITEEKIRRLDFLENLNDLINNKEDIMAGYINIESICECIENSLTDNIENVVKDLNDNWGYNISVYKKII